jgi:hypothetical protein
MTFCIMCIFQLSHKYTKDVMSIMSIYIYTYLLGGYVVYVYTYHKSLQLSVCSNQKSLMSQYTFLCTKNTHTRG